MTATTEMGEELYCYLSARFQALVSVRDNGTLLGRTPFDKDWRLLTRKKSDVPMEVWLQGKRDQQQRLLHWQRQTEIPSASTLIEWSNSGIAESVNGEQVEPDGLDPSGAPSWLLFFGMI